MVRGKLLAAGSKGRPVACSQKDLGLSGSPTGLS